MIILVPTVTTGGDNWIIIGAVIGLIFLVMFVIRGQLIIHGHCVSRQIHILDNFRLFQKNAAQMQGKHCLAGRSPSISCC